MENDEHMILHPLPVFPSEFVERKPPLSEQYSDSDWLLR